MKGYSAREKTQIKAAKTSRKQAKKWLKHRENGEGKQDVRSMRQIENGAN
jgi:hypothetical protein